MINQAPAGPPMDYHECSIDSGVGYRYIDRGGLPGDNLFAVVITGDSMAPLLEEGDEVIFRPLLPDQTPSSSDVVFVRIGNDGCTVAHWLRTRDGSIRLEKRNPRHAPRVCSPDDIVQAAVAIQVRRSLLPMNERRIARGSDADLSSGRKVDREGDAPHGDE